MGPCKTQDWRCHLVEQLPGEQSQNWVLGGRLVQQAGRGVCRELELSTDGDPDCQPWGCGSQGKRGHSEKGGREESVHTEERGNRQTD